MEIVAHDRPETARLTETVVPNTETMTAGDRPPNQGPTPTHFRTEIRSGILLPVASLPAGPRRYWIPRAVPAAPATSGGEAAAEGAVEYGGTIAETAEEIVSLITETDRTFATKGVGSETATGAIEIATTSAEGDHCPPKDGEELRPREGTLGMAR